MSKIDDLLAEEGAAAEANETTNEFPEHVTASRPNLDRPTVVSVRLSTDEHARLQHAAEEAHLPLSTIIRLWALDRLLLEEGHVGTVNDRLARLEQVVFRQSA